MFLFKFLQRPLRNKHTERTKKNLFGWGTYHFRFGKGVEVDYVDADGHRQGLPCNRTAHANCCRSHCANVGTIILKKALFPVKKGCVASFWRWWIWGQSANSCGLREIKITRRECAANKSRNPKQFLNSSTKKKAEECVLVWAKQTRRGVVKMKCTSRWCMQVDFFHVLTAKLRDWRSQEMSQTCRAPNRFYNRTELLSIVFCMPRRKNLGGQSVKKSIVESFPRTFTSTCEAERTTTWGDFVGILLLNASFPWRKAPRAGSTHLDRLDESCGPNVWQCWKWPGRCLWHFKWKKHMDQVWDDS